ncbi:hypothetical protein O6H91_Y228100 [Diphasiastrum complanatum]|nr:hypothetical protein O6H91_Y347200 [Diphasiastrum complanatum]KAJ7298962.1 hypothetical protein O6H91_Y347200 [Diphasiastrum complanatum]KAJ7299460.1 hypothetical protein O6H91_Y228100 [Diphasiastrum complanatum]
MGSVTTWFRYLFTKLHTSIGSALQSYEIGQISEKQVHDRVWRNLLQGRLTFTHRFKGEEMSPTFKTQGETLLVRSLPLASPRSVFVGDVVMFKDPEDPNKLIVRRVAALEGDEMISTNENDKPFTLEKGQCWVLADNHSLVPKSAQDSRTFGPLDMKNIVGRAIYSSHSSVDHGHVQNSDEAMRRDSAVLAVELDLDEITRQSS